MSKFLRAMQEAVRERAVLEGARQRNISPNEMRPQVALAEQGEANGEPVPAPVMDPLLRDFAPGGDGKAGRNPIDWLDDRLVSLVCPTSLRAEQYRALKSMIEQRHAASRLSLIAVCSPGTADGRTTTAINLAGALAQSPEARVLLVDADLHHSSIGERLGLGQRHPPGLTAVVLNPSLTLDRLIMRYPSFNLDVLPVGRPIRRTREFFESSRFAEFLRTARELYDYVVVDTPPLIAVPDSRLIAKRLDGVLIVVAAHQTSHKMLKGALTILDPGKLLALVFNGDDEVEPPSAEHGHVTGPPHGREQRNAEVEAEEHPWMTSVFGIRDRSRRT